MRYGICLLVICFFTLPLSAKDLKVFRTVLRAATAKTAPSVVTRVSAGITTKTVAASVSDLHETLRVKCASAPADNAFFSQIVVVPPVSAISFRKNLGSTQLKDAQARYKKLTEDFGELRSYINTRLYYAQRDRKTDALTAYDKEEIMKQVKGMWLRLGLLEKTALSEDEQALEAMRHWFLQAQENMDPSLRGLFVDGPVFVREDRVWDAERFFLHDTRGADVAAFANSMPDTEVQAVADRLQGALPANLRVAVLNDYADVLDLYRVWQDENLLGDGRRMDIYFTIDELLAALASGTRYDVILTDLSLPDGSGRYLVSTLREAGDHETAVLGSSFSTEESITKLAPQLFGEGFDGYFSTRELVAGPRGKLQVLRALSLYTIWREQLGWSR